MASIHLESGIRHPIASIQHRSGFCYLASVIFYPTTKIQRPTTNNKQPKPITAFSFCPLAILKI